MVGLIMASGLLGTPWALNGSGVCVDGVVDSKDRVGILEIVTNWGG